MLWVWFCSPTPTKMGSKRVYPILSLNPYQGNWTIKVRVTSKSPLRTFKNARGNGNVFNVELTDEDVRTVFLISETPHCWTAPCGPNHWPNASTWFAGHTNSSYHVQGGSGQALWCSATGQGNILSLFEYLSVALRERKFLHFRHCIIEYSLRVVGLLHFQGELAHGKQAVCYCEKRLWNDTQC